MSNERLVMILCPLTSLVVSIEVPLRDCTFAAPTCHNDVIWGWRPHPGLGQSAQPQQHPQASLLCTKIQWGYSHLPEHEAYHTCNYKQCYTQVARVGRQSYLSNPRLSTPAGSSEAAPVQLSGPTSSGHHQRVWHPLGDNLKPDPAVTQAARGSGQP